MVYQRKEELCTIRLQCHQDNVGRITWEKNTIPKFWKYFFDSKKGKMNRNEKHWEMGAFSVSQNRKISWCHCVLDPPKLQGELSIGNLWEVPYNLYTRIPIENRPVCVRKNKTGVFRFCLTEQHFVCLGSHYTNRGTVWWMGRFQWSCSHSVSMSNPQTVDSCMLMLLGHCENC